MGDVDVLGRALIVVVALALALAAVAFAALGLDSFVDVWRKSKRRSP